MASSGNKWGMEELNHRHWWDHFMSCSDQSRQIHQTLVTRGEALGLDKANSMVSVGPATGELDAGVIRACMGQLKEYIGVEPDPDLFDGLTTTLRGLQGVQVQLVQEAVPVWSGPPTPVDMVLVSHVLYYLQDPMACVHQFYSWVRPGGSVILLHGYKDDFFNRIARDLGIRAPKAYGNAAIKDDLVKEGFTFEEMDYKIHVQSPDDDRISRLYFEAWVGLTMGDEMQRAMTTFKARCQGKDVDVGRTEGCITIRKPQN